MKLSTNNYHSLLGAVEYEEQPNQSIEEKKLEELRAMKEVIDSKPTLKDAWKQFSDIYSLTTGKVPDILNEIEKTEDDDTMEYINQIVASFGG